MIKLEPKNSVTPDPGIMFEVFFCSNIIFLQAIVHVQTPSTPILEWTDRGGRYQLQYPDTHHSSMFNYLFSHYFSTDANVEKDFIESYIQTSTKRVCEQFSTHSGTVFNAIHLSILI